VTHDKRIRIALIQLSGEVVSTCFEGLRLEVTTLFRTFANGNRCYLPFEPPGLALDGSFHFQPTCHTKIARLFCVWLSVCEVEVMMEGSRPRKDETALAQLPQEGVTFIQFFDWGG